MCDVLRTADRPQRRALRQTSTGSPPRSTTRTSRAPRPHEHVARLAALGRADDAAALHEVHEPAGLGEADAQLALQHARAPELRRDDQLDRRAEHLEVVADLLVDLALGLGRRDDVLAERRLPLLLAVRDDRRDLRVGDERALDAHRLRGAHRQEQAVALADELLRPGWSRMTLESVPELVAKARRLGTFALIRPVTTSTDGRCVAMTRWMPAARASWVMRTIESSTSRGATIMRSASSSMITMRYG
jgi:hypothetical protein